MPGSPPRGVLFDLDGVFYVDDEPIPGAVETMTWVRREGLPHLFVTNTTSHPRVELVAKLARLGISANLEQVLSPAVAARDLLVAQGTGPVSLFLPDESRSEFHGLELLADDAESGAAAVVVGDLGESWDFERLNRAFRLLMAEPRPLLVSLGMTRYWRATDGLRLDVAPFTRALEAAAEVDAVVTGKPAPAFFDAAAHLISMPPSDLVMVGDDVRGDVGGAMSAGMRGVLVRTGKFTPADLDLGIAPTAVLDSVAAFPGWWRSVHESARR